MILHNWRPRVLRFHCLPHVLSNQAPIIVLPCLLESKSVSHDVAFCQTRPTKLIVCTRVAEVVIYVSLSKVLNTRVCWQRAMGSVVPLAMLALQDCTILCHIVSYCTLNSFFSLSNQNRIVYCFFSGLVIFPSSKHRVLL